MTTLKLRQVQIPGRDRLRHGVLLFHFSGATEGVVRPRVELPVRLPQGPLRWRPIADGTEWIR